jgi:hypothetical protein
MKVDEQGGFDGLGGQGTGVDLAPAAWSAASKRVRGA